MFHARPGGRTLAAFRRPWRPVISSLGDMDVSETSTAGAITGTGPLVSGIFANDPCVTQQGGTWMTQEAVVEAGNGGPALLLWQVSGWTQSPDEPLKAQPVIAGESDSTLGTACFTNLSSVHTPLLRRRALVSPLPPGESFVQVAAATGVCTDGNDSVTMTLLNLGAMSAPPQVRLSIWSTAVGTNGEYTSQPFDAAGGPLLISVSATAWSQTDDQPIGAVLYLDGEPIAYPKLFANQSGAHMGLVGSDVAVYNVSPGGHTLALMAETGTVCDIYDTWSLTVMEMQGASTVWQAFSNTPCREQSGGQVIASCTYEANGGVQVICVSLSGYSLSANQMLQAHVLVDGDPVGSLQIFANQASTHLLLCGGDIAPGKLPIGGHEIEVIADDGMVTDGNDTISLTILELFD